MSSKYSDLLRQLIPDVGDAHAPIVETFFRRSLCLFMETSQVWRTIFDSDLAAASPDPATRATLLAAYEVARAAASAAPSNLNLAQAAADALAAATAKPALTLTRPLKTAAIVSPPTPAVYYTAIVNPALRVTYQGQDVSPWWRIDPPTAAGGAQTLVLLPPLSMEGSGRVRAHLVWVPTFDADPDNACPDWVYERYGGTVSDMTIGLLWTRGYGRKANPNLGMKMREDALNEARSARNRKNQEDPLPFSI